MRHPVVDIIDQLETLPGKKPWGTRRSTNRIAVHHSETHGQSVFNLNDWHVHHNKWYRLSYHYVITDAGVIYKCNEEDSYTYHVGNSNRDTLGVCLIGNFDTKELGMTQQFALIDLLVDLCMRYELKSRDIVGHRELPGYVNKKTCPGTTISLPQIRDWVATEHVRKLDLEISFMENRLHMLEEENEKRETGEALARSQEIRRELSKRGLLGGF